MYDKDDKRTFHAPYHVPAITFFIIGIILSGIIVSTLVFNQSHIVMAQQQQNIAPKDISFDIDNMTFSHHMTPVNGIQLHYVIGGHGPTLVLLHGWPETWYEWRHVMPALAKNYTVIAPDLRGLGDSSKPSTGYDGKTVAEDIHQLVTKLGYKTIFLVGHDIGSFVAYSYAAAHPSEVKRLVIMDVPPAGFFPPGRPPFWWVLFHQTPLYRVKR